jgi:hypothetical protein
MTEIRITFSSMRENVIASANMYSEINPTKVRQAGNI